MEKVGFALITLFATLAVAEVPSYMHVCGRRNPNLDKCVLESVDKLKDKLKNGLPDLDVPPLEPLFIDSVALVNLANFVANARNVSLNGLSDFIPKKLHVDLEKQKIDIEVEFKTVSLTADYDVNAKILVPVVGRGPIDMVSKNVNSKNVLKYKLVNRKGKEYLYFATMNTKLTVDDYTANFAPKDGPESPLATAINTALATNRQELIDATIPNLEKSISERILAVANKICKHFTYDELFPDRE